MTAVVISFEQKKVESKYSFCKKPEAQVKNMIQSSVNGHHICDECIKKCQSLIGKQDGTTAVGAVARGDASHESRPE